MKKYSLRFIFHGHPDRIFVVTKKEADRLEHWLLNPSKEVGLFLFSASNGLSVAVNLKFVQAVQFLWDTDFGSMEIAVEDSEQEKMPECVSVCLHGKEKLLELGSEDLDQVFLFFMSLERPVDVVQYAYFDDEDGETIYINKNQIVWLSAPNSMIRKGEKIIQMQD